MGKYFSVGEAAQAARMTRETLRHYDRIGLVKPSKVDEWTKYRYYTEADLVRLHTVRALQQMDLPLAEIGRVLNYDSLEKIVDFLTQAERKAEEKIAALQYAQQKIRLARADYEGKLQNRREQESAFVLELPKRVILLSDTLEAPSLDTLWNYLRHFYDRIAPELRENFAFEDLAGIYTEDGTARLFAVCIRYVETEGLRVLPEGKYLCANYDESSRERVLQELTRTAREAYGAAPRFTVQQIVISGILQWRYQAQIYLGSGEVIGGAED